MQPRWPSGRTAQRQEPSCSIAAACTSGVFCSVLTLLKLHVHPIFTERRRTVMADQSTMHAGCVYHQALSLALKAAKSFLGPVNRGKDYEGFAAKTEDYDYLILRERHAAFIEIFNSQNCRLLTGSPHLLVFLHPASWNLRKNGTERVSDTFGSPPSRSPSSQSILKDSPNCRLLTGSHDLLVSFHSTSCGLREKNGKERVNDTSGPPPSRSPSSQSILNDSPNCRLLTGPHHFLVSFSLRVDVLGSGSRFVSSSGPQAPVTDPPGNSISILNRLLVAAVALSLGHLRARLGLGSMHVQLISGFWRLPLPPITSACAALRAVGVLL
ncbi:hypothetical protein BaRGS_00012970 [Batillaria attramentaria]|uniref:Uncharacterized protein n=1 Tax=Batillaria attramentaria TaxID=370345 RepID=A0ABD0L8W4_9CAEN